MSNNRKLFMYLLMDEETGTFASSESKVVLLQLQLLQTFKKNRLNIIFTFYRNITCRLFSFMQFFAEWRNKFCDLFVRLQKFYENFQK